MKSDTLPLPASSVTLLTVLLQVPAAGVYYFNLNVGAAAAYTNFYIDDVTLTSEPNAPYANWVASAPVRACDWKEALTRLLG